MNMQCIFELNDQRKTTDNSSDDKLILTKYKLRCQSLEIQIAELLKIRENMQELNVRNNHISKSLLKLKAEYDLHLADLSKTLFNLKVVIDKQQILSARHIDEFMRKRKNHERYIKKAPLKLELEELINRNNNLQEEWKKVNFLLNLTKSQYDKTFNFLYKTFKMKVCEFCDTVCRLKAINH